MLNYCTTSNMIMITSSSIQAVWVNITGYGCVESSIKHTGVPRQICITKRATVWKSSIFQLLQYRLLFPVPQSFQVQGAFYWSSIYLAKIIFKQESFCRSASNPMLLVCVRSQMCHEEITQVHMAQWSGKPFWGLVTYVGIFARLHYNTSTV